MNVDRVKQLLGLTPHPREGGCFIRTYESSDILPQALFGDGRYTGDRHVATAIYYLLEPETFSEMHSLRSDEIFHFSAGDAVEMLQLYPDGDAAWTLIGNKLDQGERPQVVVPRGVWQGSRLVAGGQWALLGCTVSPGFDFADYEAPDREILCARWPKFSKEINTLIR